MSRIFNVAVREFLATVTTRGFIFGILMTPVLVGLMILVLPLLFNDKPPRISGEIAVVDPTGEITAELRRYLTPEAILARRGRTVAAIETRAAATLGELSRQGPSQIALRQVAETALGEAPSLDVVELSAAADLEAEKATLRGESSEDGGRLALVRIHDNAIRAEAEQGATFGSYDIYVRPKLDDRIVGEIRDGLRHAIVESRSRAQGLDPATVRAMTRVERTPSIAVTEEGEETTHQVLNVILPVAFMMLLFISVLTGGQYLMTTTIEEKSSRVVEVLLAAVSPLELMTGKIVGQMCVGLLMLALYAGMGVFALASFAFLGLIDPILFVYLVLFYLIAYFFLASLMAAIGAAVNELREAQTLMTPLMLIIMVPWFLWMPISRDPNSTFATVTSFVPPINTFAMLLRITSTTPPPAWQVWLSILIGLISVYGAVWFAAKVFRVGLLMYARPPNLATLVRWVRMA